MIELPATAKLRRAYWATQPGSFTARMAPLLDLFRLAEIAQTHVTVPREHVREVYHSLQDMAESTDTARHRMIARVEALRTHNRRLAALAFLMFVAGMATNAALF